MTERSSPARRDGWAREENWGYRAGVAARVLAVALGTLASALQGSLVGSVNLTLLLGALALIVGLKGIRWGESAPRWAIVELGVAGVLLGMTVPFNGYFLTYFVAAGAMAGVTYGIGVGLGGLATAAAGLVLAAGLIGTPLTAADVTLVVQWLVVATLGVLAAGWSQIIWRRRNVDDRYQAAYQLLLRLREVTRELPSALDDVTAATTMLDLIGRAVPFERAAVLRIDDDGPPHPLAISGGDSLPWYPEAQSWLMRRINDQGSSAQSMAWLANGTPSDPRPQRVFRAIIAIEVGGTRIGLVILQRSTPWSEEQLDAAEAIVERSALMLDTAFVFGDVRALATTEERRRLAREIHDGIAQEIAGLAYVVDDVAHRERQPELQADLGHIRDELTRVVSELRLSIFELRSGVEPGLGLGSSLSTYVRQIGTRAGMTVHMVLEEDATRLPADLEVEIMRIVQEAITNARRHSRAKNLWVTLRTSPPRAFVRVADDGIGMRGKRRDSYGIDIMKERSERIGGRLDIRQRVGGGTVVDLTVGEPIPASVRASTTAVESKKPVQRGVRR